MSFTRIIDGKQRILKLRCYRCGSTNKVIPVAGPLGTIVVDLCKRCRDAIERGPGPSFSVDDR